MFGLNTVENVGLTQFVTETSPIAETVYAFKDLNLNVMPAGGIPPNPLEILSSERFKQVLELFKQKFDHIIIDSAPSIAVSDSIIISQLVSQVVYVVKAEATSYQLTQEGIKRLNKVNAPITGLRIKPGVSP